MATSDIRALIQSASFNGQPPFPGSDSQSTADFVVFREPTEPHVKFSVYQVADSGKFKCIYQVDSGHADHRIPSIAITNIQLGVFEGMLMGPLRRYGFFEEMKGELSQATIEKVQNLFDRLLLFLPERHELPPDSYSPIDQRIDLKNRATNLMLFCYNKEFEALYKFVQKYMGLEKTQALQYLSLSERGSIADAVGCATDVLNPIVQRLMLAEIAQMRGRNLPQRLGGKETGAQ